MPPRNLLIIALTAVISLACYSVASKNKYANLFAEAMEVVEEKGLHKVPREDLFDSAMVGMLKDLDEHSMYISDEMFKAFDEDMRQEFGGVGMYVELDPETQNLVVLAPMPGTPAYEAGLKPGDQIIAIDGNLTSGQPRREAIKMLRGPIGEAVEMEIERDGERDKKMVQRASIPVPSALGDYRSTNGDWKFVLKDHSRVGYIRLTQFGEKSADEISQAIKEMGPNLEGLIVDLRNNSGGLLDVAVEICDIFLPADLPIVKTRGRDKVLIEEHYSSSRLELNPGIPLCVLVNRNSASASEIVAACLQDHGRAILVGEQSWGKGTVQNVIPIQRGESALKLTVASYWRPSGKSIDRHDQISKETQMWGVQADEGYEVITEDAQIFENMRQRNLRDLRGLVSEEDAAIIDRLRTYTPDPDAEDGDISQEEQGSRAKVDPNNPYVDEAIEKALEYFRTFQSNQRIAA